jgi:serine/threonine-protein kinase
LLDLLGRGGMGEVWRAFDTVTERVVALKVLPTEFADDAVYQERFRREARSAAGLDEPHVVPIHDFGEIDGRLFVTMRLIKGRDLHGIISEGRLESARAVGIIDQVASALHAAHQVDLVHRDVKPSNILVGNDDFAYLIDFGIARAAGQSGLTSASSVIGTWAYMAPERLTTGQTDARSDVYALACVLYECLTGRQPFPGDSLEQQIGGHIAMPPPSASDRHADVPTGLDAVIAKGMAKDPDERFATTRELAHAAKSAVTAHIPRPAQPPTTPAPVFNPYVKPQPRPQPHYRPQPQPQPGPVPYRPTFEKGPSADPTQYRAHPNPNPNAYPVPPGPPGPPQNWPPQPGPFPSPPKSRKGLIIALSSVAVVAVVAIVAAIVLIKPEPKEQLCPNGGHKPECIIPGPLTGAFSVAFGPQLKSTGDLATDAPPAFTETWRLRSECGPENCVATAASSGQYASKSMVFDKVGDSWLAVSTSTASCKGVEDSEAWNAIWLDPESDGTMSGESTQSTNNGCYNKRTVTFTRTGDTDLSTLPDPARQAPRVVSPAAGLHGRYHN